jgi:hypothetical protein
MRPLALAAIRFAETDNASGTYYSNDYGRGAYGGNSASQFPQRYDENNAAGSTFSSGAKRSPSTPGRLNQLA